MIEALKANIGWIKDVGTLVTSVCAIGIAILTYRRARATILAPIRTEVAKQQSAISIQLLKAVQSIDTKLDYHELVRLNVLRSLIDFGFVLSNQGEIIKELDDKLKSWILSSGKNQIEDIRIVDPFGQTQGKEAEAEIIAYKKRKYDAAKAGSPSVDRIWITADHKKKIFELSEFSIDPFMPSRIQELLNSMLSDISQNLSSFLKGEVEHFVSEIFECQAKGIPPPKFDIAGVFNRFNHSRIHHRETEIKIRQEIRRHLRIDDPLE